MPGGREDDVAPQLKAESDCTTHTLSLLSTKPNVGQAEAAIGRGLQADRNRKNDETGRSCRTARLVESFKVGVAPLPQVFVTTARLIATTVRRDTNECGDLWPSESGDGEGDECQVLFDPGRGGHFAGTC